MISTWPFVMGSKEPGYTAIGFMRRPPSLLLLHLGPAAGDRAGASFGHDHLHAALRANVDLSDLIRHAPAVLPTGPETVAGGALGRRRCLRGGPPWSAIARTGPVPT